MPHEVQATGGVLPRWRLARVALPRGVDRGLHDHQLVHGLGQLVVRELGTIEIVHGAILLSAQSKAYETTVIACGIDA